LPFSSFYKSFLLILTHSSNLKVEDSYLSSLLLSSS
jgi:hypothetical protein